MASSIENKLMLGAAEEGKSGLEPDANASKSAAPGVLCPGCNHLKQACKCKKAGGGGGGGDEDGDENDGDGQKKIKDDKDDKNKGKQPDLADKSARSVPKANSSNNLSIQTLFLYSQIRHQRGDGKSLPIDKEATILSGKLDKFINENKIKILGLSERARKINRAQLTRLLHALLVLVPGAEKMALKDIVKILKDPDFRKFAKELLSLEKNLAAKGKAQILNNGLRFKSPAPHSVHEYGNSTQSAGFTLENKHANRLAPQAENLLLTTPQFHHVIAKAKAALNGLNLPAKHGISMTHELANKNVAMQRANRPQPQSQTTPRMRMVRGR